MVPAPKLLRSESRLPVIWPSKVHRAKMTELFPEVVESFGTCPCENGHPEHRPSVTTTAFRCTTRGGPAETQILRVSHRLHPVCLPPARPPWKARSPTELLPGRYRVLVEN